MSNPDPPQTPGLPQLPTPFVNAAGLCNFRDAGGHPVTVGDNAGRAVVRRGVLFRSAEIAAEGGEALRQLGITRVYDLRSAKEDGTPGYRVAHGEPEPVLPASWAGIDRVWLPVFLDLDYSAEAMAIRFQKYSNGTEGFVAAYRSILEAAGSPDNPCNPFGTILETLASSPTPPILVHCSAGKDRTGVLVALVLSLLGVDDDTIAADYHLTELGLAHVKPAIVSKLTNGPHLGGDRAKAERMVTASKESMLGTLAMIRDTYGSAESYLVDHCRVSRETLERLRRNLVVEVDGVAGEE
ncbi:protein-tyrosine phosphatase-like protein [Podospora conica]|nr:protein-tyrosine phosphatase-like protein [Schizothecium conicum]